MSEQMTDITYSKGSLVKMSNIEEYTEKTFENIKHINEFENEYWCARELQIALGYKVKNR